MSTLNISGANPAQNLTGSKTIFIVAKWRERLLALLGGPACSPRKFEKSKLSDWLKLLSQALHYAISSQIFYDILSCVINCNYPQITAV